MKFYIVNVEAGMKNRLLMALMAIVLSGCYTVNQERFEQRMSGMVKVGMHVKDAGNALEADGFQCDARTMALALTCTKTRESLAPYTCIERVNIYPSKDSYIVEKIDIRKIICAGL